MIPLINHIHVVSLSVLLAILGTFLDSLSLGSNVWLLPGASLFGHLGAAAWRLNYQRAKLYPIGSMYGIFTNIYPINDPNVGKYTSTMDPMGMGFLQFRSDESLKTLAPAPAAPVSPCSNNLNSGGFLEANPFTWPEKNMFELIIIN